MTWASFLTLLEGTAVTVLLSVTSLLIGIPLGLALAGGRIARIPVVSGLIAAYVSLMRGAPIVTFVLFVFFGIAALGVSIHPQIAALIALSLNTAAFNSEVWRASIVDFPIEQLYAARAIGMTRALAFRRIVLPQIWRTSLPGIVNEMTLLIKGSPAVAVVGVVDLTRAANRIAAYTYEPLPPYVTAMMVYGITVLLLVRAQQKIERFVVKKYGGL
jgi:His/Glu/Gln/Arg/opine family amino acid ABC transporter permease subunit